MNATTQISLLFNTQAAAFGVLLPYWVADYASSPATVSWLGTIPNGFQVLFGVMVGPVIEQIGLRKLIGLTMIIYCGCTMASTYVNSMWIQIATYSLPIGISIVFCFHSTVVVTTMSAFSLD